MEGIIYKVQAYQENSKLLFVYTKFGKKTLLARGAQKINSNERILSQYMTKISFEDSLKQFIPLKDAKILNDYQSIKESYELAKDASLILELLDKLVIEDHNHDLIYSEASNALDALNIKEAAFSFAIKLLRSLGYGINLHPDGRQIKGVNIEKGGLVYIGDNDIAHLDTNDAIVLLKLSLSPYDKLDKLEDEQLKKIKNFIKDYYLYHIESKLNSLS